MLELFITTYFDDDGELDTITHWSYEDALEWVKFKGLPLHVINKVLVLVPCGVA